MFEIRGSKAALGPRGSLPDHATPVGRTTVKGTVVKGRAPLVTRGPAKSKRQLKVKAKKKKTSPKQAKATPKAVAKAPATANATADELAVAPEPVLVLVIVRYNHYQESFETLDGVLDPKLVDERLCLHFAFKKCRVHLTQDQSMSGALDANDFAEANIESEDAQGCIQGLLEGIEYWVVIEEDPAEKVESEKRQATFNASRLVVKAQDDLPGSNAASRNITKQLKGLTEAQLKAKGAEYKQMLEARDLEDVLFS